MSTIGTAVLVEDDDNQYSLYKGEYDPEMNAVVCEWGGDEHKFKLDGEGGVGSFCGGGLALAYRRLGALSSVANARASREVPAVTDGGTIDDADPETELEVPLETAGVKLGNVMKAAPHKYDPEDLVKAEQRGYLFAKEESSMPSYALIIGTLMLGLLAGALLVYFTTGSDGGSTLSLMAGLGLVG
ncbi:hypothetical protein D8Y22_12785 [Salinadaptatus halalkaliphilus]|uniref:Uncharacterized protein n=2 Tax=Salinadaptatus halalkaliphilus TaxID=2419781 RepID=A0A4S3TMS5_9EURY|nr:hypothetical protein D8Y22_12785 [Salinadaptatus halalkaliphilus]